MPNWQSESLYYFALIYHREWGKEMMKTTCLKLKLSPQDVLKQDRRQDYYFGKKLKINDNEKELSWLNFVKFLISLTTALILDMVFIIISV